ncbi:MAG TPA: hypothetical protein VJM31_15115 [Vicinamibacterales bacterium]|nr:hypothetical protein [Vicinamibacterales bacterium]
MNHSPNPNQGHEGDYSVAAQTLSSLSYQTALEHLLFFSSDDTRCILSARCG